MKLFTAARCDSGYEISVEWGGVWMIVFILFLFGFAVHVLDRVMFG